MNGVDDMSEHVNDVANAILLYLMRNPNSADTKEGIRDSWLRQQRRDASSAVVDDALVQLVEQGLLRRWRGPDGRDYFELKRPVPTPDGQWS